MVLKRRHRVYGPESRRRDAFLRSLSVLQSAHPATTRGATHYRSSG
jgi:hypothetical protein